MMSHSATITFSEMQPDRLYKITTTANVRVYYSGKLVYGPSNENPIKYFIANDTNQVVVTSTGAVTGTVKLTEMKRSYYEAYDGSGGTWCFQKNIDRWTSKYSYRPEWIGMVGGRLVTFKYGKPYIHIAPSEFQYYNFRYNTSANQFYDLGGTHDSVIAFVHNEASTQVNVYTGVAINNDTSSCGIHIRTEPYNYAQSSYLTHDAYDSPYPPDYPYNRNGDFRLMEDMMYATIKRDRLSPNVTGTPDEKEVKGDPMRGSYGLFQVEWTQMNVMKKLLRMIDIGFTQSRGHKTIQ